MAPGLRPLVRMVVLEVIPMPAPQPRHATSVCLAPTNVTEMTVTSVPVWHGSSMSLVPTAAIAKVSVSVTLAEQMVCTFVKEPTVICVWNRALQVATVSGLTYVTTDVTTEPEPQRV